MSAATVPAPATTNASQKAKEVSTLLLPMHIRAFGDPFGYVHGQTNHEGIKHPGYDLNDGPDAWADEDQDLTAPGHGLIVFSGSAGGWGTLIVGLLSDKQPLPEGGLGWLGFRLGHPKRLDVRAGDRVKAGEVIGTCGNGGNGKRGQKGAMAPHGHYDLFRREQFAAYGRQIAAKYGQAYADRLGLPWTYWDNAKLGRDNFGQFFVDPAFYHPELKTALSRAGRLGQVRQA